MAAMLVSSFTQYIGTSADVKPNVGVQVADGTILRRADCQPGMKFLETDTGITWSYDGFNWQKIPTDGAMTVVIVGVLIEAVQAMHRTLEMMRQGQIIIGTCEDVNPADVAGTSAELVA